LLLSHLDVLCSVSVRFGFTVQALDDPFGATTFARDTNQAAIGGFGGFGSAPPPL